MPLAPNPLLQTTPVVKTQPAAAAPAPKAAETGKDNTQSFAQVYSKQAAPKSAASVEPRAKPVKAKPDTVASKPPVDHKTAAAKPAVADSGKSLPADKVSKKTDDSDDDKDDVAGTDTDKKATDPLVTDAAPVDPTLDPNALQAAAPQPTPELAAPVVAAPTPPVEMPAVMAAVVVPQPPAAPATDAKAFDPASDDPLAGLAAVQVALEQGGKATAPATPTAATGNSKTSGAQTDADPLQSIVNNLAIPADQPPADNASAGGGDSAFKGMIEAGLKDTKVAASDTRIDDFANRLAAMSDAVQPKTAATPVVASPLSQPLAMHQGGWSEGVVDRVMYLSSQNLKSADIQLEPAELGRLDIRVNMTPDQQTQVTFMSGHAGVREALEGQMNKLRDSFAQQGLGQVDVSVSDQSRGWSGQGQQQQEQANQGSRTGNASGSGTSGVDGIEGEAVHEVAQTVQPMQVIGSSQVDYYA
ncbi:MAG: Flagellar hook-length control protein [Pseudomonas sp.]|nr:Flagellar hook-length control protein [Pseudomonas sp.]